MASRGYLMSEAGGRLEGELGIDAITWLLGQDQVLVWGVTHRPHLKVRLRSGTRIGGIVGVKTGQVTSSRTRWRGQSVCGCNRRKGD